MHDFFETLVEYIRGAWRFRWFALVTAWVVCVAGWVGVLLMKDTYEASARVFVDTRTTLSQATEGIAMQTNVDSQIQLVRQALLGGPQLEKVVKETGLDAKATTPQRRQELMTELRDRVQIATLSSSDSTTARVYLISFRDQSRERSLKVVDRLLNAFVESTLGGKREGSQTAQRFLVEQIADYERRLRTAEESLAAFKKANVGLMPGVQGDYFTRLQAEMDSLNKAQTAYSLAARRRSELQRQLNGEDPLMTGASAQPLAGGTAGLAGNDTATRIRETQARLDELLLRFTDRHPDVLALRQTLVDLRERQQQEIAAVRRGDAGAAARSGLSANPVFQNIQLQLNQTDVELATLRGEIATHRAKIDSLRKLLNTAPEVEAEFARLNRDYDVTNAQYRQLVERLERARLAEEAEATGVVRFDIIDPPSASFTPVAPNRPRLIMLVLFAGLAGGAGLAYLLHQLRPVFSSSRQLAEITGRPVLGTVSMTWLEKHQAMGRRSVLLFAASSFLLVILGGFVFLAQSRATRLLHEWLFT